MDDSNVRTLLPVKQKNGKWIYPTEVVERKYDIPQKNEQIELIRDVNVEHSDTEKTRTLIEKYAIEQKKLKTLKVKVGVLCHSITTNPVNNMRALKEMITMLQKSRTKLIVSEKKLLSLSLLHVFNDILPGYKIRNSQETDSKLKLKKQTKMLLNHELALLRYYKKFIDALQSMIRNMKPKNHKGIITPAKKKALVEIGIIATKCLCELLVSRYYFNYNKTIISIVVPLVGNRNSMLSSICCTAIEKLYKTDKLGEASLEAVKQTVKTVKERNFCVPSILLKTFLALNLQEANKDGKKDKRDMKSIRKQLNSMSRKEKRHEKKMRELEQQLRETEAHESKETKSKLQTEMLKKIFWIYFHVLKDDEKMDLMTPVLEGLSKFAHLINLEFFDDLSSVLCSLMENEKLGDMEKLHCMQTMFIILSGQAESLNVDPQRLYSHFYHILLNLNYVTTTEQFKAVLYCVNLMIIKRKKKITFNRILAFIKRLCTISAHTAFHFTIAALCVVRTMLMENRNTDILLDTENTIGSGIFLPELEDPEYCNANCTSLWELHLLLHHYHPVVSNYAQHLIHGCPIQGKLRLPDQLSKLPAEQLLELFSEQVFGCNIDFEEYKNLPKRLCTRKKVPELFSLFKDDDFCVSSEVVKNVSFI